MMMIGRSQPLFEREWNKTEYLKRPKRAVFLLTKQENGGNNRAMNTNPEDIIYDDWFFFMSQSIEEPENGEKEP